MRLEEWFKYDDDDDIRNPTIFIGCCLNEVELQEVIATGDMSRVLNYLDRGTGLPKFSAKFSKRFDPAPELPQFLFAEKIKIATLEEGTGGGEPEAVGVSLCVDGFQPEIMLEIKSPESVDRIVASLVRMRNIVWPQERK